VTWRGPAAVLALSVAVAAVIGWATLGLGWPVALVLAAIPLVIPGAPAALMLVDTIRHGDPYDVLHRYR
jgi:hypothetical protein